MLRVEFRAKEGGVGVTLRSKVSGHVDRCVLKSAVSQCPSSPRNSGGRLSQPLVSPRQLRQQFERAVNNEENSDGKNLT